MIIMIIIISRIVIRKIIIIITIINIMIPIISYGKSYTNLIKSFRTI